MSSSTRDERLAFLEMLARWQGSVRNSELVQQFQLSRQQIYKDICDYQRQFPQQLTKQQDGSYQLRSDAPLQYFSGELDTFLLWLQTGVFSPVLQRQSLLAQALLLPSRQVSPAMIAMLLRAMREQLRLEVGYVSLSNPETDGRLFSPHTFVKAGGRWHVRGFCEKSNGYRDLVLSRFRGEAMMDGVSNHTAEQDTAWNTFITLVLAPDHRLTPAQQAVLINDYQMPDGQLQLTVRAALADYLLKEMQVNTKYLDGTPEAQQLVLVNRNDVKQWLFSG